MRWAFGLVLVALGCDSFAGAEPAPRDVRSTQPGVGGTKPGPTNGAGGTISFPPPDLIVDVPMIEPEPDPEWCTVARQQGATFCEERKETVGRVLEYCEPAPAAPPSEGGAAGMGGGTADTSAAGAGASAAGADTSAAGADTSAAGAGGPGTGQSAECVQYDRPPEWVYDLLIQCAAHCGVGIAMSERKLEGSCCYLAQSEYYGR